MGRYGSASEAVRSALHLLEAEEAKYGALMMALTKARKAADRSDRDVVLNISTQSENTYSSGTKAMLSITESARSISLLSVYFIRKCSPKNIFRGAQRPTGLTRIFHPMP
ncbi:MAG TPA: type II toxin-antitoxin system ParD family antitoxin [Pricia sp.]|nr:type II toxin-antitoxin system ParD family antitoxin [Pricia sp.]